MRVTESQLINLATEAAAKGRDRLAEVGQIAASGVAVDRPSKDGVAWAEGTRADARNAMSNSRGSTIARSHERLTTADNTLNTVDIVLQRAVELATQMANGTYSAQNRKYSATEILALRDSAIAAANARDNNGEFVFAGTRGDKAPFDANGVYQGDATVRTVEVAEHETQLTTVTGTVFTGASGVDIFGTLKDLATAMSNDDPVGIRNALPTLGQAVNQVSSARSIVGTRQQALEQADSARKDFETNLAQAKSRTTDADPIAAASELAKGKLAFDTAQAMSQQIMSVLKNFQ